MNNGKVRIYELSKELSLDNKDILGICEQLNISVKSHSSTITETQAQRIRTVAQKHVSNQVTAGTNAGVTSSGRSTKNRKPEILAIRSKKNQSPTVTNVPQSETELSPKIAIPPRPLAQPKPMVVKETLKPPTSPNPPEQSQEVEQPLNESSVLTEEESPLGDDGNSLLDKPQLLAPPARPSKPVLKPEHKERPSVKGEGKSKGNKKPVKVKSPSGATPPTPVIVQKPKTSQDQEKTSATKPVSPVVDKPAKAPQKLQRPHRPAPVAKIQEPETLEANEEPKEELIESEELLGGIEKPKPKLKLKRPSLPRTGKKTEWEEDEDDQELKGKPGKAATKNKRAKQSTIIDDDDDELGNNQKNLSAATVAVSLSIARPPKPNSMAGSGQVVTSAKRQKRPNPVKSDSSPSRSNNRERRREQQVNKPPETVTLTGNLTIRDLADMLNTPETDIVKRLFFKGIAVNITQTLDVSTAALVAQEMGVEVELPEETSAAAKTTEMLDEKDLESLQRRPPVVTIMGHVDHGKTTLLDSIRKTKVAAGEAGGITQHIGAYHVDVEHNGQNEQIVFLDTPGHEAFTAMRARGTRVTDIAVLVVAADDGVQPQTKEAISHAKAAKVPLVVAINKIDKAEAEPDRIKQELTEQGLVPEEWGGETIMVPVSAIQGENLDTLLEMLLLVAEIEELSANPDRLARGTVVEANLDKSRGPVATLLVQNGTLKVGDSFVAGPVFGKIRAMIDDRGDKVEAASPSFAVEVLGLNEVPAAGDEFEVFASEKEARAVASRRAGEERESRLAQTLSSRRVTLSSLSAQAQEGELKELNLILKADVQGSVEAILGSLDQLPQNEVQIRILLAAPGEVTETDVDLAAASGAVVIGFNTNLASGSRAAADQEGVDIREYNIIYNLLDDIQGAMEGLLEPEEVEEPLGEVEVRAVFKVGRGSVAGCYVLSGKVIRNCRIRVRRKSQVVYEGGLDSLKRVKDDVKEVNSGYECGVGVDKFNDWQEGDIIEAYQMVFKRRTLASK